MTRLLSAKTATIATAVVLAVLTGPGVVSIFTSPVGPQPQSSPAPTSNPAPTCPAEVYSYDTGDDVNVTQAIELAWKSPTFLNITAGFPCRASYGGLNIGFSLSPSGQVSSRWINLTFCFEGGTLGVTESLNETTVLGVGLNSDIPCPFSPGAPPSAQTVTPSTNVGPSALPLD